MLIVSQNMTNYDVTLPDDTIFRINLAWINDLETLKTILEKHDNHKIFIDLPKNRTKPPNNRYSMDEIKPILESYHNIKYFAISNVDSAEYLAEYIDYVPKNIVIVPKIESPAGVKNIEEISELLGDEKIVMLDHDDLYSSILKKNDDFPTLIFERLLILYGKTLRKLKTWLTVSCVEFFKSSESIIKI